MPLSDAEVSAILHPVWANLLTEAEARLLRIIDHATGGGGRIIVERTEGFLDGARVGTIADESVVVGIATLPAIATQEQLNAYLLAALQAISVAAFDPDTILTNADGDVLVNADGNVLIQGAT